MSILANARGVVITGQNVTMNACAASQAADRGFEILCKNATPSALYGSNTSEKDPGCLPGTRVNVQEHIFKWLDDLEGEVAMWMYGPAGIGKTAIAQTIATLCAEAERLVSSFFFFRSDEGRNSAKHLAATLAFEMVQQMPYVRDIVCAPIAKNPLLFSALLERQIKSIILPGLLERPPSPRSPMLIIIDGLDECHDIRTQQLIIQSFISLLASTTTPICYKLLIVSRPESHIVSTFSAANISPHVRHLCLDEWDSIADIEVYLRAELETVRQTHPLKSYLDIRWPSDNSFCRLLDRSFESFAYATSAARYISSHDRHPEVSLNHLLDLSPGRACDAHAELDALYRHILESLDEHTRLIVLKFLCLCSLRNLAVKPIGIIGSILGEETYVLELALKKISSVIRFDSHSHRWSYYHTSFADFLKDNQRSGELYIYSPMVATIVSEVLVSENYIESPAATVEVILVLDEFRNAPVDMQIHLLQAFQSLHRQSPKSIFSSGVYFTGFLCAIECGSRLQDGPEALNLQLTQAFKTLVTWLQLYVVPWSPSTVLNIGFELKHRTPQQEVFTSNSASNSYRLLRDMIKSGDDPQGTIFHLFPTAETLKISIEMVKIYLNVDHGERRKDDFHEMKPLHNVVARILQSEPANAEICHILEKCVVDAAELPVSSTSRSPQGLICNYLCKDSSFWHRFEDCGCAVIAQYMDLYIRKTHSELDLSYITQGVGALYCEERPEADDNGEVVRGVDA